MDEIKGRISDSDQIGGKLSSENGLSGRITNSSVSEDIYIGKLSNTDEISGKLSSGYELSGEITSSAVSANTYKGSYEFTPTETTQTIEIANKRAAVDIIINPIPSNYGRITWNGSVLTIT